MNKVNEYGMYYDYREKGLEKNNNRGKPKKNEKGI